MVSTGCGVICDHRSQFAEYYVPNLEPKRYLPWRNTSEALQEIVDSRQNENGRIWIMLFFQS